MADIVPIELGLDDREVFTLYAPRWRDANDEWEAFLGKDDDLYAFESVPDLVAFVRSNTDNDLADHPAWEALTTASAHKLKPKDDRRYDLVNVYELLAEKPTQESVEEVAGTLAIASAIGSVCELAAISKFFNGNPVLSSVSGGIADFSDRAGLRRWDEIGAVVGKGWDKVIDAIDEVISTPDVDVDASSKADAELDEPAPEEEPEEEDADEGEDVEEESAEAVEETQDEATEDEVVLGADEDFWEKVGIDPIRIMASTGTFYTLRCYYNDGPVFLGRNGRISVFGSERALARYLADEHDHDLSGLSTYDDIRTAATDGSLHIDITEECVYVLTGVADDLADGPEGVDRAQLEQAVEFLREVGDYSEDSTVADALESDTALGKVVAYVLDPDGTRKPRGPYAKAVDRWTELETFVESRLRQE